MKFGYLLVILILFNIFSSASCADKSPPNVPQVSLPTTEKSRDTQNVELQPRGKGTVELVTAPVHDGTHSARLAIPEGYSFNEAARIAVPLDDITLNEITSLSYWCYIDEETPNNAEGYWLPYITFELDTDGQPGCDTWIIGGGGERLQSSSVWVKKTLESNWLFHVASVFTNYESPFPLIDMGTLTDIKAATGPDGKTLLCDYPVSKIRLAIGNWGEGGPRGPVICYVDYIVCNGRLIF